MTPKEKAQELVHKMYAGFVHQLYDYKAKQCALIAVDEIIANKFLQLNDYKNLSQLIGGFKTDKDFNENLTHIKDQLENYGLNSLFFWQEVKQEIEKI